MCNSETPYVVWITACLDDGKWESVTEFYFDKLDEAFHFFDNDAERFILNHYIDLYNNVKRFEVSIWDDTFDNGEALEATLVAL